MYGARVYKTLCACDSGLRRLCAYRPQTKTRRSWGEAARPGARECGCQGRAPPCTFGLTV